MIHFHALLQASPDSSTGSRILLQSYQCYGTGRTVRITFVVTGRRNRLFIVHPVSQVAGKRAGNGSDKQRRRKHNPHWKCHAVQRRNVRSETEAPSLLFLQASGANNSHSHTDSLNRARGIGHIFPGYGKCRAVIGRRTNNR